LELKAAGVPVLHYYSMGKSENIKEIASRVLEANLAIGYIF
jgi:methylenetetrahydrofolate reductase (NADPH)